MSIARLASHAMGFAAVLALGACGNKPPIPDWEMTAHDSSKRAVIAYLKGDARVEAAEFDRARKAAASTGNAAEVARVELLRCAARTASLVVEPCAGFEALRADVPAAERAYADYLAGKLQAKDVALLPEAQRRIAAGTGASLAGIEDPLSKLVAAGVLFQAGKASPDVIAQATEAASLQGWRRPLLAWLLVQLRRVEQAGASDEAERLKRRIALVESAGAKGPAP